MEANELLKRMVEIRSHSREEQEVAEFLVATMKQMGFEAHIDAAGNAVGIWQGEIDQETTRDIVLLGHMDTVPGNIPVRIEGDLLYGRGSVDAKGPLATFIAATAKTPRKLNQRIIVIGAVEEEAATSKGARHVATQYQPECCVIGEPSNWDAVTLGYKGRMLVDYKLHREMQHTAGPDDSVAEDIVNWWQQVKIYAEKFNQDRPKLFDQLFATLRRIHTSSDGLIDTVEATAGFRLPLDFDTDAFAEQLRKWGQGAHIECYAVELAYQSNRSHNLARVLMRAIGKHGQRPRCKVKTGTSDMNVVGPIWQCPILAYGPGDSSLDHTPNEHISLTEYNKAIEVLSEALTNL